jgi:D-alanyl-D-alanine carboxypeptidase (penicillin-binding protein 5/6)
MTVRVGRSLGIALGTLVILAAGIYGPATLLGPLPAAKITLLSPAPQGAGPAAPVLPAAGGSALVRAVGDKPFASAGAHGALPMASAAKLVEALVVLKAKPLDEGAEGPAVAMTVEDYESYLGYANEGARTVAVFPGEAWTERQLLQALVLGSSNNHADTIARWAFGSVDSYLENANAWLTSNGLTGTHVADAAGLDEASAGTAGDLAKLAALAAAHPVISEILSKPASALADRRGVQNTTAYLPELGVTGISRSYTDAGGVCFLFTAAVDVDGQTFSFAGAMLGEPDYETLTTDLTALMKSAAAGVRQQPVLAEGAAYARYDTVWDQSARAVVKTGKTRLAWVGAPVAAPTVKAQPVTTARAGSTVGRASTQIDGTEVSSPLVLDRSIGEPGLGWRLLHPVPIITELIESRSNG